ncbi:hypothetical protein H4582DRAFT_945451 [Lactarius indigo]|nr:hypothetical protein H4582DRAFT_945451 [Lactarius indigo]
MSFYFSRPLHPDVLKTPKGRRNSVFSPFTLWRISGFSHPNVVTSPRTQTSVFFRSRSTSCFRLVSTSPSLIYLVIRLHVHALSISRYSPYTSNDLEMLRVFSASSLPVPLRRFLPPVSRAALPQPAPHGHAPAESQAVLLPSEEGRCKGWGGRVRAFSRDRLAAHSRPICFQNLSKADARADEPNSARKPLIRQKFLIHIDTSSIESCLKTDIGDCKPPNLAVS